MSGIIVGIAAPAVRADEDAWRRVARYVSDRRRQLGAPTDAELVERAGSGLSIPVLSRIGNAARNSYSPRSLTALCRALGWTPNSIDRILNDDEPVDAEAGDALTIDEKVDKALALLSEIREELAQRDSASLT